MLNSRAAGSLHAYEKAAEIVRQDADNGKLLQQFLIAVVSRDTNPPKAARIGESDRKRFFDASRDKIKKLAEHNGNPLALYLLSMENNDRGLLERAANGGNVQALNAYGTELLINAPTDAGSNTNKYQRILKQAYDCFKRASDKGDANGLYNLGMCHMSGYGCKRDEKMAFDCFRAAAEAGHPEAINNLGGFFRDGIVVNKNVELSVVWFKKSCELGNEFGALNYALALLAGEGIEQNQTGAVKLLKYLSEKRESAEGMNLYGMCFLRGTGVEKDSKKAVEWFEKSAAKGLPMAMDNLSQCYEHGEGVKPDIKKSLIWKMRGRAAAGDPRAKEWLKDNDL